MSALRLLFAWLLLAALPLQGFAAATTLLCGPAHHGSAQVSATVGQAAPHRLAGASHAHDHAMAAPHHDAAPADALAGAVAPGDAIQAATDAGHGCNLCLAACHGVGLTSQPMPVAMASAPRVPLTEPFQRFDSRPAPVPDKPPRA